MEKGGWVYIVASKTLVLYTGVTNDIGRRAWEHREHRIEGFTRRYNCDRLVYMEHYSTIEEAIAREKQLKKWRREKKLWLIKQMDPGLSGLYDDLNR